MKLNLDKIDPDRPVQPLDKHVWCVVMENNHLLIEIDLDGHSWFVKKSGNRMIAYFKGKIPIVTKEGSGVLPRLELQVMVFDHWKCGYCGQQIEPREKVTHFPHVVHDGCWANYLKMHPELKKEGGKEDEQGS